MLFDHLLVVAPTLRGGSALDMLTHLLIDFHVGPLLERHHHQFLVLLKKVEVPSIFLGFPVAFSDFFGWDQLLVFFYFLA